MGKKRCKNQKDQQNNLDHTLQREATNKVKKIIPIFDEN